MATTTSRLPSSAGPDSLFASEALPEAVLWLATPLLAPVPQPVPKIIARTNTRAKMRDLADFIDFPP